jgi:Rrf2 family cysteine metabolism transcriptional repressor
VVLARYGPLTAPRLADEHGLSRAFLQQVLLRLRIAGLVGARRGSTGGYWLRCPADGLTLGAVVRALRAADGELTPAVPPCGPIDRLWLLLDDQVAAILDGTTIADLAVELGDAPLPSDGDTAAGAGRAGRATGTGDPAGERTRPPAGPVRPGRRAAPSRG